MPGPQKDAMLAQIRQHQVNITTKQKQLKEVKEKDAKNQIEKAKLNATCPEQLDAIIAAENAKNVNETNLAITKEAKIARKAGLNVGDNGIPRINSAEDWKAYDKAAKEIKAEKSNSKNTTDIIKLTTIKVYNCFTKGEYNKISSQSSDKNILTEEHQYYLNALTQNYENNTYYEEKGYKIDAYLLMGICFGESNADINSQNPFGRKANLNDTQKNTTYYKTISALKTSKIASDDTEAKAIMDNDHFYECAAEVLSYLDNGKKYNVDITANYESLIKAIRNIERWRNAASNNSQEESDYAYYYYY